MKKKQIQRKIENRIIYPFLTRGKMQVDMIDGKLSTEQTRMCLSLIKNSSANRICFIKQMSNISKERQQICISNEAQAIESIEASMELKLVHYFLYFAYRNHLIRR